MPYTENGNFDCKQKIHLIQWDVNVLLNQMQTSIWGNVRFMILQWIAEFAGFPLIELKLRRCIGLYCWLILFLEKRKKIHVGTGFFYRNCVCISTIFLQKFNKFRLYLWLKSIWVIIQSMGRFYHKIRGYSFILNLGSFCMTWT